MVSNFLGHHITQDYATSFRSVCSFQCIFLIDDVLFNSKVIRCQVVKLSKIGSEFSSFRPPILRLRGCKFLTQCFKLH